MALDCSTCYDQPKSQFSIYDPSNTNPDICLYNSAITEFADIAGFYIEYYISTADMDYLFGDDPNTEFIGPFTTRIIYEPSEEPKIFNALGAMGDDTLQYAVTPKAVFDRDIAGSVVVPYPTLVNYKPKVGDVIKTLWNNNNYVITDLGSESKIFLAKKLVWEFILRPFNFSAESDTARAIHSSTVEAGALASVYIPPSLGQGEVAPTYNSLPLETILVIEKGDNDDIETESNGIGEHDIF